MRGSEIGALLKSCVASQLNALRRAGLLSVREHFLLVKINVALNSGCRGRAASLHICSGDFAYDYLPLQIQVLESYASLILACVIAMGLCSEGVAVALLTRFALVAGDARVISFGLYGPCLCIHSVI